MCSTRAARWPNGWSISSPFSHYQEGKCLLQFDDAGDINAELRAHVHRFRKPSHGPRAVLMWLVLSALAADDGPQSVQPGGHVTLSAVGGGSVIVDAD